MDIAPQNLHPPDQNITIPLRHNKQQFTPHIYLRMAHNVLPLSVNNKAQLSPQPVLWVRPPGPTRSFLPLLYDPVQGPFLHMRTFHLSPFPPWPP